MVFIISFSFFSCKDGIKKTKTKNRVDPYIRVGQEVYCFTPHNSVDGNSAFGLFSCEFFMQRTRKQPRVGLI